MCSIPRLFPLTAFFAIVVPLAAFMPAGRCSAADKERPNVLLVCVDDLRNCLELDGDPVARTPNLDRLASEGRYFRHHYVQVAAYLADGSSIDDVVLLASPVEEVAVNLVELHVVVTGPDDHPVGDLRPEEFTVIDRGVPRTIDTFAYADDVPLLAGVVIDTSGSMELVMHDTRRAAARATDTLRRTFPR